jgi:hypothetical protein
MLLPDGVELSFHSTPVFLMLLSRVVHEHLLLALGKDWCLKNANINQFKQQLLDVPA